MVATRTISSVTGTISQTVLGDTIKSSLQAIGYTFVDDFISGTDRILVFSLVFDASKTFGTVFLRVRIMTNGSIQQSIATGFNSTSKAFTNLGVESSQQFFTTTSQLDVRTYVNAPEYRLLVLSQTTGNTPLVVLGILRPSFKPTWWDENNFPYAFCFSNASNAPMNTLNGSSLAPFSTTLSLTSDISAKMSGSNSISLKRELIPGVLFYLSSNNGVGGRLSEDFAAYAGSGTDKFGVAQVTPSVEEYDIIYSSASSIVIRVS